MKVLILNTGSSSVKYSIYECENGDAKELAKGLVERIGATNPNIKCDCCLDRTGKCPACAMVESGTLRVPSHKAAISAICDILTSADCGVVSDLSEIAGIGHRVVHGGEEFSKSTLIDEAVIAGIEKCCKLAPLHNPPALQGIRACQEVFPGTPQVAVFDTAFHASIPSHAYRYPIPTALYSEHGVRKYGFHGTSHRYVSEQAVARLSMPAEDTRVITCHLGNGCSISAVKGGKCIETSMGLTPLGGVMMGTRTGDLDPYLPLFMMKELGMSVDEVDTLMNKKSGLLGVCGHNDMRDILKRAEGGDKDCQLAVSMFCYSIARFIGSYAMVLGGVDAIVFTAGIGENNALLRSRILETAGYLGCHVDAERNAANAEVITTDDSTCKAFVIPTNEELVITRHTARLVDEARETATA